MQQTFMKTRPVLPLVLSMSFPMVLSMMVASLYNIVDSYYVAQISEDAMTALSLVFPIQNLINAVTIGFSIGANAVIYYHLGAQEHQKANAAAAQSIICNIIHGIVLTIGCILVIPFFLKRCLETDMEVVYAQFPDNSGVILARLDGEWNHDLDDDLRVRGVTTVEDVKTGAVTSYNAHTHTCPDGTTFGPQ